MRTKFKAWTVEYLKEHPEVCVFDSELGYKENVYLEIGSGKGDFLLKMALNNPDKEFVGVEKNVTCAGITAKKLVDNEIKNAKLLFADAEKIIELFKDESVNSLFLNFSDPWPKRRHHKRRLTSEKFLKEYYRIIHSGGKLIFKTDNIELFNDSLDYFSTSDFKLVSLTNNYAQDDPFDTISEYEQFFINEGTPINRVVYKK